MYIANYWLTFHVDGNRVLVRPGAPLPAGISNAEIRALLDAGAIRTADKPAVEPEPEPVKPRKSKTKQETEQ